MLTVLEGFRNFIKHWGIPFLFADRFSGAVVHLTTGGGVTLAAFAILLLKHGHPHRILYLRELIRNFK
jgi:hypothetical protein